LLSLLRGRVGLIGPLLRPLGYGKCLIGLHSCSISGGLRPLNVCCRRATAGEQRRSHRHRHQTLADKCVHINAPP
jgi:hypothetical protein